MSYSEFKTIAQVQEKFGLTVKESENLFVDIQPLAIGNSFKIASICDRPKI